jgi:hypothetical protein
MSRLVLLGLFILSACTPMQRGMRGECLADCTATTLVQLGMAIAADATAADPVGPFCDDNDPPHTCPGTTPGPVTPPAPGD